MSNIFDMAENTLLTIILPTFNRCDFLDEMLRNLLPQVSEKAEKVRVFVSDNASTDNTQQVIDKYLNLYPHILGSHRQESNLGAQANFQDAVKRVNSKYVALIGDDDVLSPWYLDVAIMLLEKFPNAVLFNFNVICANYSFANGFLRQKNISGLLPVVYENGADFIYDHLSIPSLISSNIFDRKGFISHIGDFAKETYPGYDWLAILYFSCVDKQCIFYGYPLIIQRYPAFQRWGNNGPWFHIYGLGRLFHDLDKKHSGLFNHWIDYSHSTNRNMLEDMLPIVYANKGVYQSRYKMMKPYLGPKRYARKFWLHLYLSPLYVSFLHHPLTIVCNKIKADINRMINIFKHD